ncbi:MAG TPA: RHS repeat-associated core domain-containing protein [Bacteroidia bacterium]
MAEPGRNFSTNIYRYGFNGMEKNDEWKGSGNIYTTEFRQYDPRLGRWGSTDPMTELAPEETPYSFGFNAPIILSDPSGLFPNDKGSGRKGEKLKFVNNRYQTFQPSRVVWLICPTVKEMEENKKGTDKIFSYQSPVVTSEGVEPSTF